MICPKCNKRPIERNRKKCTICLTREATNSKNYRIRKPDYILSMQKVRERYKDEGRCISCGNYLNPDCDYGRISCVNCRGKFLWVKQLR